MAIRENPSAQLLVAVIMFVLGSIMISETFDGTASEDDVTVARPLSPRAAASRRPASSTTKRLVGLMFCAFGVGFGLYGVRQIRSQGQLLRDGVPVVGRIVHLKRERKRDTEVTYRFEDEQGVTREGVYYTMLEGGFLDFYSVGQEVTVIYDPKDSCIHMLDVDNVRRGEAEVRRI